MFFRALLLLSSTAAAQPPQPSAAECGALASAGAFSPIVISNSRGLVAHVLPYGGTVQRLLVPTADGGLLDIVQGFDDGADYCRNSFAPNGEHPYYGALIGRIANRIANCSFVLGGVTYTPPCNEFQVATGLNDTLHGGPRGYDRRVWTATPSVDGSSVTLVLNSADMEEGFPSSISVTVTYTMVEPDTNAPQGALGGWDITYVTKNTGLLPTIAAHTQHTYWMLSGFTGGESTVLSHTLQMPNASSWQEVDAGLIPTGRLRSVTGADAYMSFQGGKPIGTDIVPGVGLPSGAVGYDNSFLFRKDLSSGEFSPQVVLTAAVANLQMTVFTDQPAVQVYSGNFLDSSIPRKASQGAGLFYDRYSAVALETQQRIGSSNDPALQPAITLQSGETHSTRTAYMFQRLAAPPPASPSNSSSTVSLPVAISGFALAGIFFVALVIFIAQRRATRGPVDDDAFYQSVN